MIYELYGKKLTAAVDTRWKDITFAFLSRQLKQKKSNKIVKKTRVFISYLHGLKSPFF